MSKQVHSQGDWQVRETATHYQIHTAEHEVALVRKVTDGAPGWSSEKDALLIKASPKLLTELRKAADTMADSSLYFRALLKPDGAEAYRIAEQSLRAAIAEAYRIAEQSLRAAIAEATGEAP